MFLISKIIIFGIFEFYEFIESNSRKTKYDQEYEKFEEDEDNNAEDVRIKLERNCKFYVKKAALKLEFLHEEAKDPFMSKHNLGKDFRRGNKRFSLFEYFESSNF